MATGNICWECNGENPVTRVTCQHCGAPIGSNQEQATKPIENTFNPNTPSAREKSRRHIVEMTWCILSVVAFLAIGFFWGSGDDTNPDDQPLAQKQVATFTANYATTEPKKDFFETEVRGQWELFKKIEAGETATMLHRTHADVRKPFELISIEKNSITSEGNARPVHAKGIRLSKDGQIEFTFCSGETEFVSFVGEIELLADRLIFHGKTRSKLNEEDTHEDSVDFVYRRVPSSLSGYSPAPGFHYRDVVLRHLLTCNFHFVWYWIELRDGSYLS